MNSTEYIWPEGEKLVYVRPPVEEYNGNLDYFYSSDLFPELKPIKENWKQIRDEIIEYEHKYGNIAGQDSLNAAEVKGEPWTLIYLKSFSREYHKNKKKFPVTAAAFDSVPSIVFAGISILPPNTHILPHYGDTNGIIRAHLALIVPAPYPTIAIKVGDEETGWTEGEILCFVNVQKHEVWNKSDQRRYVIMFDFVPKVLSHRTLEICSKGLGSQSYNYFYKKFAWYRKLPVKFHELNIWAFTQIWKTYIVLNKVLKIG